MSDAEWRSDSKRLAHLEGRIDEKMKAIDERFDSQDEKLDNMVESLDRINLKMAEQKGGRLMLSTITHFMSTVAGVIFGKHGGI